MSYSGFKIKNLGPSYRAFTADVGPLNLTAGVHVAELYIGLYSQILTTDDTTLTDILTTIGEVLITRRGQTTHAIENGLDLLALNIAPWFDHLPWYSCGGTSALYNYVKSLTVPCAFPSGYSGEFQLTIENTADAGTGSEEISIAEGQGFYAHNYFGQGGMMDPSKQHFHIVKRLYDPAAAGWNAGLDIGTEGTLIGILCWQTAEDEANVAKTAVDLYEMKLDIGGENVIYVSELASMGRHGARTSVNAHTADQDDSNQIAAILDQYVYFDFARQPWDCRGKTVNFSTNAGTSHTAIRVYPIYLVDW